MYCIYLVELHPRVWAEKPKFRKRGSNRKFQEMGISPKKFYYVGASADPVSRVASHVTGGPRSNPLVRDYFKSVQYCVATAERWEDANELEFAIAERLIRDGNAVWYA